MASDTPGESSIEIRAAGDLMTIGLRGRLVASNNGKPAQYKLVWPIDQSEPGLSGLTEVDQLKHQLKEEVEQSAVVGSQQ